MAAKKKSKQVNVKAVKQSLFAPGEFIVKDVVNLSFFDLTGEKSKTKGSSNKQYATEVHVDKNSDRAQVYFIFGAVGGAQNEGWKYFDSYEAAKKEFDKTVKSKKKKGYTEIDLAQKAIGSEEAKKIIKPVKLKNINKTNIRSSLNEGQKKIVEVLFGAQEQFVITTLKCPLGQLSNEQIDKGRDCLNQAKNIVNVNKKISDDNKNELTKLTNLFYSLIPHNLGSGFRGQMTDLLLDDIDKIVKKEEDLDTLLDAKNVNASLDVNSSLDAKYKELECEFELLDQGTDLFKFISDYFEKTKVSGHGYHYAHVKNIWKMTKNDTKTKQFTTNAKKIAEECGKHVFVKESKHLFREPENFIPSKRFDLNKNEIELYNDSNTWLCWHGTRTANLVGITRRGLLIRPSGAVHTGSLFGDGKYFAYQSSKSLNYSDGGFWTGGYNKNTKYMFLLDVAFGNMYIEKSSRFFKNPPKGYHSVYGKAGGYLMNDEMITYDFNDSDNQSKIRYLLEIS